MKNVKAGHERPIVYLDAGHYGKYNQSPVIPEYYESEMNWKLHLLLRERLEKQGLEVYLTRLDPEADKNVYERGTEAIGADLLLSIHSNAAERQSADHPVVYVPLDGSGTELGKLLGACIRDVMDTNEPERVADRQGEHGDYYGIIRGAAAVGTTCLILEHSFHTNRRATEWLMKDENLEAMADAETKVLLSWFGIEQKAGEIHWYRIRKSWEDSESQMAAYISLEGAMQTCPVGYRVYDWLGNEVYSNDPEIDELPEVYTISLSVIRRGARSELVKSVQMLLSGRNFPCDPDGIFGEETEGAVMAWQASNGLRSDGVVDCRMMARLIGAGQEDCT